MFGMQLPPPPAADSRLMSTTTTDSTHDDDDDDIAMYYTRSEDASSGEAGHVLASRLVLLCLRLACVVCLLFVFVLLQGSNTPAVTTACGGALWIYMLLRALGWMLELLQLCCCTMYQLGAEGEEIHSLSSLWYVELAYLIYCVGFALYATFVVPSALVDRAPACECALNEASFTGTYTLAVFAWLFLVVDWLQVVVRGLLFVARGDVLATHPAPSRTGDNEEAAMDDQEEAF
jgi:hypothetical protein